MEKRGRPFEVGNKLGRGRPRGSQSFRRPQRPRRILNTIGSSLTGSRLSSSRSNRGETFADHDPIAAMKTSGKSKPS